jgi:hypothetical protein
LDRLVRYLTYLYLQVTVATGGACENITEDARRTGPSG